MENFLEKHSAAEGVLSATAVMVWTGGRWSGCSGWRTRSETDIGGARIHASSGAAGRDRASTVRGRDLKIKITFAQYMFRTRNGLLEVIFRKMTAEIRPRGWMRQLRKYMGELGISPSYLRTMSGPEWGGGGWGGE